MEKAYGQPRFLSLAVIPLSLLVPLLGHGGGLGLGDLIQAGLTRNRELILKRQEVHAFSVDTLGAATTVNPHLEIEARHNLTDPERPTAGVVLSRDFRPGIRGKIRSAAKAEWEARRQGVKAEELDLTERIRTAFFDWQIANRKAEMQEAVIERWEGLAGLAAGQMAQGKISEVDLVELRMNAVKARQRALALRSEREDAEERLRLLTGGADGPAPLDSLAMDTLPSPPVPALLNSWATEASPLLSGLEKGVAAEKLNLRVEEGMANPGFKLSLGYGREAEGDHMIGGGIELPLAFFARNQAAILRARSSVREAELRKGAAAAALESEIAETHRRLQALAERYALYRNQARELIRKQLRLAESGFRQGMLGVFDLSRVQAEYLAQEEDALDVLASHHREWNRLAKAVGGRLW